MSDNNTKTIKINPEFFKPGRTRKRGPSASAASSVSSKTVVPQSTLKNRLSARARALKASEGGAVSRPSILPVQSSSHNIPTKPNDGGEFTASVNYFTDLMKKKSQQMRQRQRQKIQENQPFHTNPPHASTPNSSLGASSTPPLRPRSYHTSTLKTPNKYSHQIELELPSELKPTIMSPNNLSAKSPNEFTYTIDSAVPYGCLKNGSKQCYKSWNQTRKNYERNVFETHSEDSAPTVINTNANVRPPTPPKKADRSPNDNLISSHAPSFSRDTSTAFIAGGQKSTTFQPIAGSSQPAPAIGATTVTAPSSNHLSNRTTIRKTIRRKYTLGKSSKFRKVGVLIKNKGTRKIITGAHKELKRTSMSDVRTYLRKHGIIKVGSTAPNDVLRNMFEAAVMAGDITNSNNEYLLHNYLNDPDDPA